MTEAGYKGEPLTLLIPTGDPVHTALTAAVATQLRDIGLTVEERALPARVLAAALRDPDDTSLNDWSAVCESVSGADHDDAMGLRTGKALGAGGSDDPKASQLRGGIMDAANDQTKRALAARLQEQIYMTAPFVPLGQWFPTSAWSKTLSGLQKGLCPVFWDVARA